MVPVEPYRRILLVRLSHLGDVVHALPVYRALRERFPEARLAWAIQAEFADLIADLPGLDRTILFDRHGGIRAWSRLRRALRDFSADWAIDAQGNLKSASVTLLSRAGRRSGLHIDDWTERLGAFVINDRAPRRAPNTAPHALDRALHLARHVGEFDELWTPTEWLQLSPEMVAHGEARWDSFFATGTPMPVVLQLAAPGDVRAWPVESQRALLRGLAERGRPVLALSGPGEEALGRDFAAEFAGEPRVRHWVGQRGQRELAAFFRAAATHGALFVTCDSGPMHLAAAEGLRVVALAGPQDPARTGPWPLEGPSSPHRVVRATPLPECAPCLDRKCAHDTRRVCMEDLSADQVLRILDA